MALSPLLHRDAVHAKSLSARFPDLDDCGGHDRGFDLHLSFSHAWVGSTRMRAQSPPSWLGRSRPVRTESQRRRRRQSRVATVLLLSSALLASSLGADASAIPGPVMTREEVKLPELPESTAL